MVPAFDDAALLAAPLGPDEDRDVIAADEERNGKPDVNRMLLLICELYTLQFTQALQVSFFSIRL